MDEEETNQDFKEETEEGSEEESKTIIPTNLDLDISESLENIESEDSEQLENIIDETAADSFSEFQQQEVKPFLEQEETPLINLEENIANAPAQTAQTGVVPNQEAEQPEYASNAPQYSGNYEGNQYDRVRKHEDVQVDSTRGTLLRGEAESPTDLRVNFQAWQQENMDRIETQQEKYQVGEVERLNAESDLPFQDNKKPKRV
tara:strand:- start:40 stop:648 length:609 start_codon:yes stop_codon:yes gene_type:complete